MRSGIVFLQDSAEPSPSLAQMQAHGRRSRTEDPGDLPRRVPGVKTEDENSALVRGEAAQPGDELARFIGELIGESLGQRDAPAALLEVSSSDAKRRAPHPRER